MADEEVIPEKPIQIDPETTVVVADVALENAAAEATPTVQTPKTREFHSLSFKLKVVEKAKQVGNCAAGREFKVPESSIRKWRKRHSLAGAISNLNSPTRYAMRHPDIEDDLVAWIKTLDGQGISVKYSEIRDKAMEFARERNIPEHMFKARSSWVQRFLQRHNLSTARQIARRQKVHDEHQHLFENAEEIVLSAAMAAQISLEDLQTTSVPIAYVRRVEKFCASHRLHSIYFTHEENKQVYGKCNNPNGHGHNYTVEVVLKGKVDPKTGMVINLVDLKNIMQKAIMEPLDHRNLDVEVAFFKTRVSTTENVSIFIWNQMLAHLPHPEILHEVKIFETDKNIVSYKGELSGC
ncbi:uncharacterized protein LOC117109354 [Anneissia japonica]|uniref:uncharacterized protein LOC117109354 n=1 Tax=Anneissia japonica TaxID=1529436 RepID=UPI001425B4D0|nr:uncharacterized protein LOC117109354 [Anneissia japonica]